MEPVVLRESSGLDSCSSFGSTGRHVRSMSTSAYLPPAVAIVQPEHIRGYVHTKKIRNYLVGSNLGEGSFAKVKEAFHVLVGEKVAMKIIDKKKAQQDPYVAKNFRREAKLLQMVRHPNIAQLYEVIETDSSFYLISELCSGGELMNYIYKKLRLDEEETLKFMKQIVSAIDHLHRAGIIHRDLKVENMLLDSRMDVKIIDFGLSNEEYIESVNGQTRCNTQCGSPAYAAPELLGHKEYGKEVDIWSIGVNMYAMLTGCLPYTVEPFNITALHAKMLQNKMNPIPDHLSGECKDLLQRLLRPNPSERITMEELMCHPWMNRGLHLPFSPAPFPNKVKLDDIEEEIVDHMVHILKIHESTYDLKQELLQNRATSSTAVYHLLAARLARYQRDIKLSTKRKRSKSISSANRDRDEQARPVQHSRAGSRKISAAPPNHDTIDEVMTDVRAPSSYMRARGAGRRKSVPASVLEQELAQFQAKHKDDDQRRGQRPAPQQQRPHTSALPEVHYRKTSLPQPPTDYSPINDKEVLLRMHNVGSDPCSVDAETKVFHEKARRRQSVPSAVLEKDLATFREKRSAKSRYPSSSLDRRTSALPKISKTSPQKTHNGFIHRTHSIPHNQCDLEEEEHGAGMTRNVHSYPVSLSGLGAHAHTQQVPTAWGQTAKQNTKPKSARGSSGLTFRAPWTTDGYSNGGEEVASERRRRKLSPGDNHLPALSPTNHSSLRKFFFKSHK